MGRGAWAVSLALGEEVTPDSRVDQLRKLAGAGEHLGRVVVERRAGVLELYEHLVEARPCYRRSTGTSRSRYRR